ncbi:hypothetical protein [Meiothermus taiwanensis]|jgi:hypothetical protein|uniref:Uncharacterized protein n=2 Tax=Meiothermus taiwanensis TaxID=172827 RepID=A0A399E326_9DEIN|nr:hypothetical protein [Meiothermus taiwanensis]AWR86709.1 hypothetical protein Mtai_v1c14670 [Meiothermus taiwanensis WR-220]KIQ54911.1 hypothetical protein SY28_06170 [Meiothermus taiwanensis]KZK16055.1 hypothetical protein A3962_01110 [Meiothermus taiwanensis]RIH77030.1 hypothetical protein Mcate_01495 [Meiothermus taiwanensis]
MIARYVLTSTCLNTGTMSLTQPLRVFLQGKERIALRDEEGEIYEAPINWAQNRLEGLAPYYAKRRLGVNDKIVLHLEGSEIVLEALTTAARPARPRPTELERPKPQPPEPSPDKPEKRVRVTPYPRELIYPHKPLSSEVPAFSADLEALGFSRESSAAPWVFRAALGRRTFLLALAKFGEMEAKELLSYRQQGRVQYAAMVAGESSKAEALAEIAALRPSGLGYVSPEALQRLTKLRAAFPLGPLDVERLLREGRIDLEAIQSLEREISGVLRERSHFSAVLTLLADYSPQQVFLLADLMPMARELNLEADHLQRVLESLSNPPFLLLRRLSPGEFLMRQSVNQALADWIEYAQVMTRRLQGVHLEL